MPQSKLYFFSIVFFVFILFIAYMGAMFVWHVKRRQYNKEEDNVGGFFSSFILVFFLILNTTNTPKLYHNDLMEHFMTNLINCKCLFTHQRNNKIFK